MLLRLPAVPARDAGRNAGLADFGASGLDALMGMLEVGTGKLDLRVEYSEEGGLGSEDGVDTARLFTRTTGAEAEEARKKLVLGVTGVLAYGEGSSTDSGRKSRFSVFLPPIQRGLLLAGESAVDTTDRTVEGAGDGLERKLAAEDRDVSGMRLGGIELAEDSRPVALPTLPPLVKLACLVFAFVSGVGVLEPWKLLFLLTPTTLLAGELPGVSTRLLAIERSLDMTVDTESLSCFSRFSPPMSSSTRSMSRISFCSAPHLRFMSLCKRKISPLTVSLSSTPRSTMANTLSIAGP